MKDLTNTAISRQNILNNKFAVAEIQKVVGIKGVLFENELKFVLKQLVDFFEVSSRTIENCVEKNKEELTKNGYDVLKGKRLNDFKLVASINFDTEINFGIKTVRLGIFNFRAFLNIAMLLSDSNKARELRSLILDIVIDTINTRTGGSTKYINQRDEDYVVNMLRGEDYRKEFTDALRDCVDMGSFKYLVYTRIKGWKCVPISPKDLYVDNPVQAERSPGMKTKYHFWNSVGVQQLNIFRHFKRLIDHTLIDWLNSYGVTVPVGFVTFPRAALRLHGVIHIQVLRTFCLQQTTSISNIFQRQ